MEVHAWDEGESVQVYGVSSQEGSLRSDFQVREDEEADGVEGIAVGEVGEEGREVLLGFVSGYCWAEVGCLAWNDVAAGRVWYVCEDIAVEEM